MTNAPIPPASGRLTIDIEDIRRQIAELQVLNREDQQKIEPTLATMRGRDEKIVALQTFVTMVENGSLSTDIGDRPQGRVSLAKSPVAVPAAASYGVAKLTQKFMTLSALDDAPSTGLLAIEIINVMEERFARKVERTSLSPLLAKMAGTAYGEPWVVHLKEVNKWSITPAGREELKRLQGNG